MVSEIDHELVGRQRTMMTLVHIGVSAKIPLSGSHRGDCGHYGPKTAVVPLDRPRLGRKSLQGGDQRPRLIGLTPEEWVRHVVLADTPPRLKVFQNSIGLGLVTRPIFDQYLVYARHSVPLTV